MQKYLHHISGTPTVLKRRRIRSHNIGYRRLVLASIVLVPTTLVALVWSADTLTTRDTQGKTASAEHCKDAAPTPQPPVSEVKSPSQESQTTDESWRMRPIAGVVIGPDGSPVAGAEVYLRVDRNSHPLLSGKLPFGALPIEQRNDFNWRFRALQRAQTDASGRFAIQLESIGPEYRAPELLVVAEGLGLGYQCLRLTEDNSGFAYQGWKQSAEEIQVRLPEMVPIRGRLLTPDGTPVEAVLVRTRFISAKDYILKVCHCALDGAGAPFARGSSAASVRHRWVRSRPLKSDRKQPESLDANDRYCPAYWPRSVRTDAQGWFTLKGIPAGANVYLNLFHPEFATESLIVETHPGEIHDIWRFIRLIPPLSEEDKYTPRRVGPTFSHTLATVRLVEGVVTAAETGQPLSSVVVKVAGGKPYPAPGPSYVSTDRHGRYRTSRHVAEGYTISVYPPPGSGYLAARTSAKDVRKRVKSVAKDVRLERGKIIRGRVLDVQSGKPIRGASIVYFPPRKQAIFDNLPKYVFRNPVLTDEEGRFTVTGMSGPGYISVEAHDRSYLRSPDIDHLMKDDPFLLRLPPVTMIPIEVPSEADLEEEVVIRLKRGRSVILQAVGPKGQKLPWIRADWDGIVAWHGDLMLMRGIGFAQGAVVVPGIDPNRTRRVFLLYKPHKLGAVFDITPQTGDGPIEVRLQPTATVVGQIIAPDGKPAEDAQVELLMSFDPEVSHFNSDQRGQFAFYSSFIRESSKVPPCPDGKFTLQYVVPGAPFGLLFGPYLHGPDDIITLEPLKAGERRDVGNLVLRAKVPSKRGLRGFLKQLFRK